MRTRTVIIIAVVTLAILAVALVLSGCGGGPTTYTNAKYNFSLVYDSSVLQETTNASSSSTAGASSVFEVAFADPNGTKIGGKARDGMLVSVYKLNTTITPAMMPLVQKELEKIIPQLEQGLGKNASISAIQPVTVNGTNGFQASAKYTEGGTAFKADLYFLISGDLEYQLQCQSAVSAWGKMQPHFKDMVASFKVTK